MLLTSTRCTAANCAGGKIARWSTPGANGFIRLFFACQNRQHSGTGDRPAAVPTGNRCESDSTRIGGKPSSSMFASKCLDLRTVERCLDPRQGQVGPRWAWRPGDRRARRWPRPPHPAARRSTCPSSASCRNRTRGRRRFGKGAQPPGRQVEGRTGLQLRQGRPAGPPAAVAGHSPRNCRVRCQVSGRVHRTGRADAPGVKLRGQTPARTVPRGGRPGRPSPSAGARQSGRSPGRGVVARLQHPPQGVQGGGHGQPAVAPHGRPGSGSGGRRPPAGVARAIQVVPTGLSAVPPPGPEMPLTARAWSVPQTRAAAGGHGQTPSPR